MNVGITGIWVSSSYSINAHSRRERLQVQFEHHLLPCIFRWAHNASVVGYFYLVSYGVWRRAHSLLTDLLCRSMVWHVECLTEVIGSKRGQKSPTNLSPQAASVAAPARDHSSTEQGRQLRVISQSPSCLPFNHCRWLYKGRGSHTQGELCQFYAWPTSRCTFPPCTCLFLVSESKPSDGTSHGVQPRPGLDYLLFRESFCVLSPRASFEILSVKFSQIKLLCLYCRSAPPLRLTHGPSHTQNTPSFVTGIHRSEAVCFFQLVERERVQSYSILHSLLCDIRTTPCRSG